MMLEAALDYARRGLRVLPLHSPQNGACSCGSPQCTSPAKHPRIANGVNGSTTDETTIRAWWKEWPDANVGVATSAELVILDIDGDDGRESLGALMAELGLRRFETATVLTQRGEHYWFSSRRPIRSSAAKLGPGLDVRGQGGYVVAPPSTHISGQQYCWEVEHGLADGLEPLPEPIVERLLAHSDEPRLPEQTISEGRRNGTLTSVAGSLRNRGFGQETIEAALHAINKAACRVPLALVEVEKIAKSVARYKIPMPETEEFDELTFVDGAALLSAPCDAPQFLVRPLLPRVGVVLLSGDSGAGKTSLMLSLSLACANRVAFAKLFETQLLERPVLYLNGEMSPESLKQFLHANARGLDYSVEPGKLFFLGEHGMSDLIIGPESDEDRARLEAKIERLRPGIVVIDTARELFEVDENDAGEVRAVFRWLRRLAQQFGLCVVVCHHLRKLSQTLNSPRERVAGSRDFINSVDVHLALKGPSGRPATALLLDKTRFPEDGVGPGTEWSLKAEWTDEPRSTWCASADSFASKATAMECARSELMDLLSDGPKTVAELGADRGSRKRAFDSLRHEELVRESGKRGRAKLWKRADSDGV